MRTELVPYLCRGFSPILAQQNQDNILQISKSRAIRVHNIADESEEADPPVLPPIWPNHGANLDQGTDVAARHIAGAVINFLIALLVNAKNNMVLSGENRIF